MSQPQLEAMILTANQQLAEGAFQTALDMYTQLILAGVERADVYNNRGNARYALGDLQAAIGDYTVAIRLNPRVDYGHFNRGNCRLQMEDFEAAIRDYDRAIQFEPRHATAYFRKGQALRALGQAEAAIQAYRAGLALGDDVEGQEGLAFSYEALEQWQAALHSWQKVVEQAPENPEAFVRMADIHWRKQAPEEALQALDRALEIAPEQQEALSRQAAWLSALGQHTEAVQAYQRWVELQPEVAEAWYGLGEAYGAADQPQKAVKAWEQALEHQPAHVPSLYRLAQWTFKQDSFTLSLDYLDRLIHEDRDHGPAYLLRGKLHRTIEKPFPALRDLEMALSKAPELWESFEWQGDILLNLKRYEDAIRSFDSLLGHEPAHINGLNGRGMALGALEKWEAARDDFTQVVALAPDFIGGHFNLLKTLLEMREAEKGLDLAYALVGRLPEDPRITLTAAQVFWQAGQTESALHWGQKAARLGHPEAPAFLSMINRIQSQTDNPS